MKKGNFFRMQSHMFNTTTLRLVTPAHSVYLAPDERGKLIITLLIHGRLMRNLRPSQPATRNLSYWLIVSFDVKRTKPAGKVDFVAPPTQLRRRLLVPHLARRRPLTTIHSCIRYLDRLDPLKIHLVARFATVARSVTLTPTMGALSRQQLRAGHSSTERLGSPQEVIVRTSDTGGRAEGAVAIHVKKLSWYT
jgi:hypothetical protein